MYSEVLKRGALVLFISLIFISIASHVQAFGLSTPYMKDETLLVNPGKTYEYTITLQNNDDEEYYVDIEYSSSQDVAFLNTKQYQVPANSYNTSLSFLIIIPENATFGETYALEYSARPRVNGSGTVSMGIEIRRGITILVTDGTTIPIREVRDETIEDKKNIDWVKVGRTAVIPILVFAVIMIVLLIWNISHKISSKISEGKRTQFTISEAVSLDEIKLLLTNINDEAFEVSEIKNLFKDKLSEITTNDISSRMRTMTRKELVKELDKIKK